MTRPTEQAKMHFRSMQLSVMEDDQAVKQALIDLSLGMVSLATAIHQVYEAVDRLERRMDLSDMDAAGGHRRPSM